MALKETGISPVSVVCARLPHIILTNSEKTHSNVLTQGPHQGLCSGNGYSHLKIYQIAYRKGWFHTYYQLWGHHQSSSIVLCYDHLSTTMFLPYSHYLIIHLGRVRENRVCSFKLFKNINSHPNVIIRLLMVKLTTQSLQWSLCEQYIFIWSQKNWLWYYSPCSY